MIINYLFINNTAKDEALKVLPSLLSPKGNVFSGSNNLTHTVVQTYFLNNKGLMTPNGSWIENEMKGSISANSAQIKMMKCPVLSSVGTLLGLSEEQLVAVIAYVDGDADSSQTAYAESLSEDILNRIREARYIYLDESIQHHMVIPVTSDAKDAAKRFIQFYYSDEALQISEETCGMILPAKYSDGSTRKGTNDSVYMKSCVELIGNQYAKSIQVAYINPLFYNGGFQTFWHYDPITTFTYSSNASQVWSYSKYIEEENKWWNANWNQILIDAGLTQV